MVSQLADDELVLLVASRPDYVNFLIEAPPRLTERGHSMPPVHLWLQTTVGTKTRQFVLFSNRPPPWSETALTPPSERLEEARATGTPDQAAAIEPATPATSQSASDG